METIGAVEDCLSIVDCDAGFNVKERVPFGIIESIEQGGKKKNDNLQWSRHYSLHQGTSSNTQ